MIYSAVVFVTAVLASTAIFAGGRFVRAESE